MSAYIHDFGNNTVQKQLLKPGALITSTQTGTGVDMANGDGQCFAELNIGTVTDGTYATEIQESADNSTGWTAVPTTSLVPTTGFSNVTSASDETIQIVSFNRTKRYLRGVITVTGSPGTGGYLALNAYEQRKFVAPGQ